MSNVSRDINFAEHKNCGTLHFLVKGLQFGKFYDDINVRKPA
jgi:hypothetical protein